MLRGFSGVEDDCDDEDMECSSSLRRKESECRSMERTTDRPKPTPLITKSGFSNMST